MKKSNKTIRPRRPRGSTEKFHYYVRLLGMTPHTPDLLKSLVWGDHALELKRAAMLWGKAHKGDDKAWDRVILITSGPLPESNAD